MSAADQRAPPKSEKSPQSDPCALFGITQYECSPERGEVVCWPFERIFRQCGKGPAIEVTNAVTACSPDGSKVKLDPHFVLNPPKGRNWRDIPH